MRFRIVAAGVLALSAAAVGLQAPAQAYAAPIVTSLDVRNGPTAGGTLVTVTGAGFTQVTKVTFGTVPATDIKVLSTRQLTVRTPARLANTVHAVVYALGGKSAASVDDQFRYWNKPVILSGTQYLPQSGGNISLNVKEVVGGNPVRITQDGADLPLGPIFNAREYTATAPAHAAGVTQVRISGYGGTSDPFPVTYVKPSEITSVSPASGPAGTAVTVRVKQIYGSYSIWFGDTRYVPPAGEPIFTPLLPPGADYDFTVKAPAHAPGTVDVTFRSLGGTSPVSAATKFTYTP